jgi:uncharacterized protein (DUF2344 family)
MVESVDSDLKNLNKLLNEERIKFTKESFESLNKIFKLINEAHDQTSILLNKANKNVYK